MAIFISIEALPLEEVGHVAGGQKRGGTILILLIA